MDDEPVSSAYAHGRSSTSRAQTISPRSVCMDSTQSMDRCTAGHIRSTKSTSCVISQWCHTPVAM